MEGNSKAISRGARDGTRRAVPRENRSARSGSEQHEVRDRVL